MVRDGAAAFRLRQRRDRPASTPGRFAMSPCKCQGFSASSQNQVSAGTLSVAASFKAGSTDGAMLPVSMALVRRR